MLKKMHKQIFKYFGFIITLLSFYYIYRVIDKLDLNLLDSTELISNLSYEYLFLSGFIYLLVLYIGAFVWVYILNIVSNQNIANRYELVDVYSKSNISKYMPGNFMQFVGRNVLGHRLGYRHSELALSTLFELILVLFSGFILLITLLFFVESSTVDYLTKYFVKYKTLYLSTFFLVSVLLIFLNYKLNILSKLACKFSFKSNLKTLIVVGFYYIIAFILLGLINLFVLESIQLNWSISFADYLNILFIFIISWIAGLLVPGAPGGIGVREAIFIFLLSHSYDILVITLASIIIRLINIVGDVCFLFINLYFKKLKYINKS